MKGSCRYIHEHKEFYEDIKQHLTLCQVGAGVWGGWVAPGTD